MNALALTVYRLTSRGELPPAEDQRTMPTDESTAFKAVLPLISQPPRSLARLLDAGDPPDIWMSVPPNAVPSA
jgi:hypothetical protein